jgi:hypothetical protein
MAVNRSVDLARTPEKKERPTSPLAKMPEMEGNREIQVIASPLQNSVMWLQYWSCSRGSI